MKSTENSIKGFGELRTEYKFKICKLVDNTGTLVEKKEMM
jgi:hypothetical protein